MKYIERALSKTLRERVGQYPVVTLTGPRQSGKSTLLKKLFPDFRHVTLEDPDIRLFANEDPRGFLNTYPDRAVFDEAQNAPSLFSYMQGVVDAAGRPGMYILSGSQNFLLMAGVTQSLAGRVAVQRLLPFSYAELSQDGKDMPANDWMFQGGYPRVYDYGIPPEVYYSDYTQTYLERDVRALRNVGDLNGFLRFLKLCAGHIGQVLNYSALANRCDANLQTIKAWLSVLEASFVIFLLPPFHTNYNKRIVKSPKLYFHDTGLACSLLGLSAAQQLEFHYMKGALFENMIVSETVKEFFHAGRVPPLYFWRDNNKNEVDLIIDGDGGLTAVEIKSSATANTHHFREMRSFTQPASIPAERTFVVYGGAETLRTQAGVYAGWKDYPAVCGCVAAHRPQEPATER